LELSFGTTTGDGTGVILSGDVGFVAVILPHAINALTTSSSGAQNQLSTVSVYV